MDIVEKFWSRVDRTDSEDDCWLWKGGRSGDRYGYFFIHPRNQLAHRVAWMFTHGAIPDGIKVCHKCDRVDCVNPSHLFLGTQADNVQDMYSKGRAHNVRGEASGKTQLTELQVRELFKLYDQGVKLDEIATAIGTTRSTVNKILAGITWQHLGLKVQKRRRSKRVVRGHIDG